MKRKIIFKSEISEIKKVRNFFVKIVENKLSEIYKYELVIGEIISNIIKYGSSNKIIDVKFEIEITKSELFMRFEFQGTVLDDKEVKKYRESKIEEDIFNIEESGRGNFIVNKIMDVVKYTQKDKIAEIELYKKII